MTVLGASAAKQALAQIEPVMREQFILAAEDTAKAVAADARARLRPGHGQRTGLLKEQIAYTVSQTTGIAKVGIAKGSFWIQLPNGRMVKHTPSYLGHLIEFGHGGKSPAPAFPFMIPAAEANRVYYADRLKARAKDGERHMENIGARFL